MKVTTKRASDVVKGDLIWNGPQRRDVVVGKWEDYLNDDKYVGLPVHKAERETLPAQPAINSLPERGGCVDFVWIVAPTDAPVVSARPRGLHRRALSPPVLTPQQRDTPARAGVFSFARFQI